MRVTHSDNSMTFDKLLPGDVFCYCNFVMMRTKNIKDINGQLYNYVNLVTGEYGLLLDDAPINYVNAVLHLD